MSTLIQFMNPIFIFICHTLYECDHTLNVLLAMFTCNATRALHHVTHARASCFDLIRVLQNNTLLHPHSPRSDFQLWL